MFNALNFFNDEIDWDILLERINTISWHEVLKENHASDMHDILHTEIYNICCDHVPVKTNKDQKKNSKIIRYRQSLTKRRRKIKKRLLTATSPAAKMKITNECIEIEKKLQKSFKESQIYIEDKAVKSIKVNSKYFFSYVRAKSKVKSKIGPLLNTEGKFTNKNSEMAEILSQQYTKVFSKPSTDTVQQDDEQQNMKSILSNISISEKDFEDAIDELSPTAAAGPDGFPAILLKKGKSILATPLTILWRQSLLEGVVPDKLKRSLITPIHKGGNKSEPANYRPISLTSHLIKLFEKVLRKHIVKHMNDNNLFNESQHGFRSGRSCLSQLLEHYDTVLSILEDGANADVVYLDFAKAFDKVDHRIVLNKIQKLGIHGKVYQWIESFLSNRYQSVTVNGTISEPQKVISGVPQGSVLGPIIFLILIGDIDDDILESIVKSFADDTRVTKGIRSIEDAIQLQKDLEKVYQWTKRNNMLLNDVKFELLRHGIMDYLKNATTYKTPTGIDITTKNNVKDLGVIMSDNCMFTEQINLVIEKAKNLTSWIFRAFSTRNFNAMITLYKALVIPVLEYCSVLWCPTSPGLIQRLEEIQWSFLRKIAGSNIGNYWTCLEKLKIYSLERRRERYRIIYIWKVLENIVPNINGKIKAVSSERRGRLCTVPTVKGNGKIANIYRSSLTVHGAQLFNALPKQIRDTTNVSVEQFKKSLDAYLSKIPDMPLLNGYTAHRQAENNSIVSMQKIAKSVAAPIPLQEHLNSRGELYDPQA